VAVVDDLGQLVQLDRMDGAGLLWPDLAEALARTALDFQCPTSEIGKRFTGEQVAQVQALTRQKLVTLAGGVPIIQDGGVVGGIGVSGSGSADLDETISRQAVASDASAAGARRARTARQTASSRATAGRGRAGPRRSPRSASR
jgi:uncharacterized protein GlcG (DUF336 family)